ncbi:MAG: DUF2306 domain-containing protein [Myxococcota bacterium]
MSSRPTPVVPPPSATSSAMPLLDPASAPPPPRAWRAPATLWAVGSIAVLTAIARLVFIGQGLAGQPVPDDYDGAHYLDHALVAGSHMVLGIVFVALGPLQFSASFRRRFPAWHRVAGRVFVAAGLVMGLGGVWMNAVLPNVGGMLKYVSTHVFGVAMVLSLVLAVLAIRRGDVARHRMWMVRAFAIGLAPATQRWLLIPVFVALGEVDDLVIGIGMCAGWIINVAVGEWVLARGRPRASRPAYSSRGRAPRASAG